MKQNKKGNAKTMQHSNTIVIDAVAIGKMLRFFVMGLLYAIAIPACYVVKIARTAVYRYCKLPPVEQRIVKLKTVIIACMVAIAMLVVTCFNVFAQTEYNQTHYLIEYHEVKVHAGTTVWGLAHEYIGEYPGTEWEFMEVIAGLNQLPNENALQLGTTIIVPIYTHIENQE